MKMSSGHRAIALLAAVAAAACAGKDATGPLGPSGSLVVDVYFPATDRAPSITVLTPAGTAIPVSSTVDLRFLAPGDYHVLASSVGFGPYALIPDDADQTVHVSAGATSNVAIHYRFRGPLPCHVLTGCGGP